MNEIATKATLDLITCVESMSGVKSVRLEAEKMVVEFSDGVTATIVASPIAKFFRRVGFDVFLPSEAGSLVAHSVVPEKSPDEVINLLTTLGKKAATHS